MDNRQFSKPLNLKNIDISDGFWHREMELVRKEVIPYQWDALNDNVPGAAPSYCMHNYKAAAKKNKIKREIGDKFEEPKYTFRGIEVLPEDPSNPKEDSFYGFVFQDTDFSKWIEAVAYSLTTCPDAELEKIADEAIEIVCEAQLENGYLDTYYILNGMDGSFKNLRDNHELYCLGHLIEGAVAYYSATGKDKLLKCACKFADYIYDCFGLEEGKCKGYPGHEIAEMALVRLYEVTGEDKYKELSRYFIEQRGTEPFYFEEEEHSNPTNEKYHQSHAKVRNQSEAVGHAVRAVYLYSGMADNARIFNDESLFLACDKLWENIVNKKMYITGGIGATHIGESFSFEYDLPNDTAYAETCASIGMVFFARRMLEIKADSKYSDIMELELYNTVLSGMALDGKSFFYVNPLEVNPKACAEDERKFHVKAVRQKWFGCACCPPNIARIVSSLGNYIATKNEDTLFLHMYVGADIKNAFDENDCSFSVKSNMPWDGSVTIRINGKGKGKIALRIPGWTEFEHTRINLDDEVILEEGKLNSKARVKDGYLYIENEWNNNTIEIEFPMETQIFESNKNVRENFGKIAVKRGPIVYCAEEIDNGPNLQEIGIEPETQIEKIVDNEMGHEITKLVMQGYREIKSDSEQLYVRYTPSVKETKKITLVPYYSWNNRGEGEMIVWFNH